MSPLLRIDPREDPVPVITVTPDLTPELARLCQRLRDVYVLECRRRGPGWENYGRYAIPAWDGGVDSFGRNCQSVWPKLARFISQNGFDPVKYIRAQFQAVRADRRPPAPTTMMSEAALDKYRRSLTNCIESLRHDLRNQHYSLRLRLAELSVLRATTPEKYLEMSLGDERNVHASPLFRYCVAASAGIEAVVQYYFSAALSQYVFQQADYDEAWGGVIPYALRVAATELRQLMGY